MLAVEYLYHNLRFDVYVYTDGCGNRGAFSFKRDCHMVSLETWNAAMARYIETVGSFCGHYPLSMGEIDYLREQRAAYNQD